MDDHNHFHVAVHNHAENARIDPKLLHILLYDTLFRQSVPPLSTVMQTIPRSVVATGPFAHVPTLTG